MSVGFNTAFVINFNYTHSYNFTNGLQGQSRQTKLSTSQCSKWYEIPAMEIFQITEENLDPPANQGAYFNILLSI